MAHKRIVGYEALARITDERDRSISPAALFGENRNLATAVFLDRLCRYVHVENFQTFADELNWLFLNVSFPTIIHGTEYGLFFSGLLERFKLPPHRVVVEVVEHPIPKEDGIRLLDAVSYYHDIGCLIAIDDFGAGHSNFERLCTLKPDIVKLAHSMLLRASTQPGARQVLQGIVSLLHQAGALVVIEGIETEGEAIIAMESDADFVQGYYFAKPHHNVDEVSEVRPPFDLLFGLHKASEHARTEELRDTYEHFDKSFLAAVALLEQDASLADACRRLLEEDAVVRCYLLEPDGLQIGHTVISKVPAEGVDARFKPLEDAQSADWFRRHYLKRAVVHPGQLQVTRPYLSITGAHMCRTLSLLFPTHAGSRVLCCDLQYSRAS